MKTLAGGHFLGETVRRTSADGLVLTETRYAPHQQLPLHSHERAYVCFVRRGGYTERFASHTREVVPTTLAFHPPAERHSQRFHATEVWSFNVEFSKTWPALRDGADSILSQPSVFVGGVAVDLAEKLYREFRRADAFSPLAIEGLVLELVAELGRTRERLATRYTPPWLARVRDALETRFDESPSLGDLARLVGVHPVHLATCFRKCFGTTIGDFVRRRRVEYARGRLTSSAQSLAEIALEAGFADQSHFTRTFRRIVGSTPAQYRLEKAGHDSSGT